MIIAAVRVGTKPSHFALLVPRQVPAQLFQSLDSAAGGAPLRPPGTSYHLLNRRNEVFFPIWGQKHLEKVP